MKVLLFYASFGDGHIQVANAMERVFVEQYGANVVKVDAFRQTNPVVAQCNEKLYEFLTRYMPFIYGWSYDWTRNISSRHPLWRALALFSQRAAKRALSQHSPDIVVQLFPDQSLCNIHKYGKKRILATQLTDYASHSRWYHEGVDVFLLPNHVVAEEAQKFMSQHSEQYICGIPIRQQFASCIRNRKCGKYIVVMAGGRGVFPDLGYVTGILLKRFQNHEIKVLCGRNENMKQQLETMREAMEGGHRLEPLGFTNEVATWLQQADFVIAKAGGVSIAECLACGVPMLFYKPQPGQEARNANYVATSGAGVVVSHKSEFAGCLHHFESGALEAMRHRCLALGKPAAAEQSVKRIVEAWRARCT